MALGHESSRKLIQIIREVSGTGTMLYVPLLTFSSYKGDSLRTAISQRGPWRLSKALELGQLCTVLQRQQDSAWSASFGLGHWDTLPRGPLLPSHGTPPNGVKLCYSEPWGEPS